MLCPWTRRRFSSIPDHEVSLILNFDLIEYNISNKHINILTDVFALKFYSTLNKLNMYRAGPASLLLIVMFGVSSISPPHTIPGKRETKEMVF